MDDSKIYTTLLSDFSPTPNCVSDHEQNVFTSLENSLSSFLNLSCLVSQVNSPQVSVFMSG
jgi:hypothetical protein